MSDFIYRDQAIEAISELPVKVDDFGYTWMIAGDVLKQIDDIPSAEPERKAGHWIDTDNYYQRWKCSECGCHTRDAEPNYCPHCGTKMEGESQWMI